MTLPTETEATALDDLFNKDPLLLSDNDIERLCTELREKRVLWSKEEEASRSSGRRANPNKGMKLPAPSLEDLSIELPEI